MHGRLQEPIQDEIATGRLRAANDRAPTTRTPDGRADAMIVRAAMDLQRTAGNRSVAALVAGARSRPDGHPIAAIATTSRHLAPPVAAPGRSPGLAVQREARPEPCTDCPEAAQRLALADFEARSEADGPA